jgi:hypothetical protein
MIKETTEDDGVEMLYYFTLRLRQEHVEQSTHIRRNPEMATVG